MNGKSAGHAVLTGALLALAACSSNLDSGDSGCARCTLDASEQAFDAGHDTGNSGEADAASDSDAGVAEEADAGADSGSLAGPDSGAPLALSDCPTQGKGAIAAVGPCFTITPAQAGAESVRDERRFAPVRARAERSA